MQIITKSCGVTGNRIHKMPFKHGDLNDPNYMDYIERLYYQIDEEIRAGTNYFISGGAMGVDLDFAEAVIRYRDGFMGEPRDIKLEIAVPYEAQAKSWKPEQKKKYEEILSLADVVHYVNKTYFRGCLQKRNEYIVNKADKMLAFWNGMEEGGTWNTIEYARRKNKKIEITRLDRENAEFEEKLKEALKDAFKFDVPEPDVNKLLSNPKIIKQLAKNKKIYEKKKS